MEGWMSDIQGMFRVNQNSALSFNIQYAVCFMQDKLLFVKIGGELVDGKRAVAGVALGGIIGAVIGARMDEKAARRDSQKGLILQRLRELSNEQLLTLHKHNFEVGYDCISRVSLTKSDYNMLYMQPRSGILTLEITNQKRKKFDISAKDRIEECWNTLHQFLPEKLVG
jgi:hypothetical protein